MKLNTKNIDNYKPSQIIKAICLHSDNAPLDDGANKLRGDLSKLLRGAIELDIYDKDFDFYCKEGFYED